MKRVFRMTGGRRTGRGFTLIELLVVVSIIALLISILLPSLSRAREQAKLTVCKANISSVGKTFILYLIDLNKLPLFTTGEGGSGGWCSWSFGGWSGRNRSYWEYDSLAPGEWNIETADRPLSVYALKGGTIARAEDIVPDGEIARLWPTEETPYYKCPSDRISAQWQWFQLDDVSQRISAYDDVGTSYQLNFHWWDQALAMEIPEGEGWPYRVGVLGVQLYLSQMQRNPSRFIALMEDPADWGFGASGVGGAGIQMLGFHGRFSKHVTFFLDGHAGYDLMDTRHLHDSKPNPPGPRHGPCATVGQWTALNEQFDHESSGRHTVGDCG